MTKESRTRSILKAISWRVIASATTFTLAYLIFSNSECDDVLEKSSMVAITESILKLVIYYFHERVWQMAPRGSVRKIIGQGKDIEK
jgi:Predicted membrane protein